MRKIEMRFKNVLYISHSEYCPDLFSYYCDKIIHKNKVLLWISKCLKIELVLLNFLTFYLKKFLKHTLMSESRFIYVLLFVGL